MIFMLSNKVEIWYIDIENLNITLSFRWGRGAGFKSRLCEDDNDDHS